MFRLQALNLFRLVREYFASWGILSAIYSLTATALLQPLLENALKTEIAFKPLWALTCAALLIPGALNALPLPPLPLLKQGRLGESLLRRLAGTLGPLYLRHELRRGSTWFTILLVVIGGALLPERLLALWVLLAQLIPQRALYAIHRWRGLALAFHPDQGADLLLRAMWTSQFLQSAVAWAALGATGALPVSHWLALGPAALGGSLAASAVALEGDSGRPWLVNFFALASGALGGYLCLASPWFLLLVGFFCLQLRGMAKNRLKSVEHLDEDTLIP